MADKPHSLRSSVATRLLVKVFSIYFVVALLVTLGHMTYDFLNAKDILLQELQVFQKTFSRGIAQSIWTEDNRVLQANVKGILDHPAVVGVKVYIVY